MLFGPVFKFCFYYSILWFLSNEAKLKTSFGCFWVMEIELWWHFCKYTHVVGPAIRTLLKSSRNFWQTHQRLLQWIQRLITSHYNSKPHKAQNTIQHHTSSCTPSTQPCPPQPTYVAPSSDHSSQRHPQLRPFFNVLGPRKPRLSTKQKLTKPSKIKLKNLNVGRDRLHWVTMDEIGATAACQRRSYGAGWQWAWGRQRWVTVEIGAGWQWISFAGFVEGFRRNKAKGKK